MDGERKRNRMTWWTWVHHQENEEEKDEMERSDGETKSTTQAQHRQDTKQYGKSTQETGLACQPLHQLKEDLSLLVQCIYAGSDLSDPPVAPIRMQMCVNC